MKISKVESTYLSALRIPLIFMVVISHCVTITSGSVPIDYSSLGSIAFSISELVFLKFGAMAVAVFSVISGYFLFGKFTAGLTPELYGRECKKRAASLLLPYILWNLITWGFLWVKNTAALKLGIAPGFSEVEYAQILPFSFEGVFLAPLNGPLWYVREIIYLTALSPLIYLLIRYMRGWGLLAWYALYIFSPQPISIISSPVAMHFAIGAYLALRGKSLFEPFVACCMYVASRGVAASVGKEVRSQRLAKYFTYGMAVLFFWFITFGNTSPAAEYISRLGMPFIVSSILMVSARAFARPSICSASFKYGSATFFIYVTHTLGIITLVRGVLYMMPIVSSSWGQLVVCLIMCLSALVYSIIGYKLLLRFAPRVLEILCGGRA